MNYYKVMLVDDEEEVREAMKRRINWEEIGFTVVASAENGEDAIEKAEIFEPDVVMTDIQMPFMDGLTMLKKLKSIIPDVRGVIFSGYDEFEYAKEAIRLEAEEYILKPIDADELKEVFKRIKVRLDERMELLRDVKRLEQYYNESKPLLKEQLLIGLLEGRTSESEMKEFAKEYGIEIESEYYCVAVFATGEIKDEKLNKSLAAIFLKQQVGERFESAVNSVNIITTNYLDTVVVLARLATVEDGLVFEKEIDKICKIAGKTLSGEVIAGLGRVYGNADSIHSSYLEAKDATHYRMFIDGNQALCITDVEPNVNADDYVEEAKIRHLIREIKVGNEQSIETEITDLVSKLKNKAISLGQLQLFYAEFVVELSRLVRGHQTLSKEISVIDINTKEELEGFSSLDAFGDRLIELCLMVNEKINIDINDNTQKIANEAKQYISDHFRESGLSVDEICSSLGVGTSYFSSVFKKSTGQSFVTYLTEVRMNEAQRLLDTTDEKSYIIAGMVGYDEPNYFSYVFKKQFGMSPSKYRQKG